MLVTPPPAYSEADVQQEAESRKSEFNNSPCLPGLPIRRWLTGACRMQFAELRRRQHAVRLRKSRNRWGGKPKASRSCEVIHGES